jgi:carbamoyl-phosphate synthase large subunit
MNVQFAIKDGEIHVLEVNPRASRTVPFVAKATGAPVAAIAARLMAGERLADFVLPSPEVEHVAVKEAVLPFARFPGVDTLLGPEMRSTGEVMGLDRTFARAFLKSQLGAGSPLPTSGTAFLSVRDADKRAVLEAARTLSRLGFDLVATDGTRAFLAGHGVAVERVNKVYQGRPNIVDLMKNGDVTLVFNTTEGAQSVKDSFDIRATALSMKISYYTTAAGALAAARAIEAIAEGDLDVMPLQAYALTRATKAAQ